jgi:hypothetical protein
MKKLLITSLLAGLAASALAQGLINLDNNANTSPPATPTSTTGGLFYFGSTLANTDFNASFYGGSDANSLVLLHTFAGAGANGVNAAGPGTFTDLSGNSYSIPGALTTGFFRIDAWLGSAADYASASQKGTSGVFSNPLGNPLAVPPQTPTDFTAMPSVVLAVPEPSTFALAGLGAAALLIFRRRK